MARINIMRFLSLVFAMVVVGCSSVTTPPLQDQGSWLEQLETQAIADGVSPATVHAALDDFVPNPHVVDLDKKQPETTITFLTYRHNVVNTARIQKGAALMHQYGDVLSAAEAQTGVPAEIIVALWAVESSFGQNMGSYETVNSLATLAYEGRRAAFFRGELIAALHILDQEHMSARELKGSWAGAMGQCQFMPSTYLNYAVDGDGDGRRDIWSDPVDVIASIAHYLAAERWQRGLEWGHEVSRNVAPQDPTISLTQPDGPDGESFFTTENLRALMRWNHSTYFALSVGLLADGIREAAVR